LKAILPIVIASGSRQVFTLSDERVTVVSFGKLGAD